MEQSDEVEKSKEEFVSLFDSNIIAFTFLIFTFKLHRFVAFITVFHLKRLF
jgi:hypothetical protein